MKPIHKSLIVSLSINLLVLSSGGIGILSGSINNKKSSPISINLIKDTRVTSTVNDSRPAKAAATTHKETPQPVRAAKKRKVIAAPKVKSAVKEIVKRETFKAEAAPDAPQLEPKTETITAKIDDIVKEVQVEISSADETPVTEVLVNSDTQMSYPADSDRFRDVAVSTKLASLADKVPIPQFAEPLDKVTSVPVIKERIYPVYPERARRMNKEGTVQIELLIDSDGSVIQAKVIESAGFGFDESALEAVRHAQFKPAMIGDISVPVRVAIPIRFELR